MFKYIRTLTACSGIVETFNLPAPISEDMQCDVGTICCIDDGRLSSAKSDNGAKYLVLSNPNKKGEQTCLRIMPGMILEAEAYFNANDCKVGDGVTFIVSPANRVDSVELGGTDGEIIAKSQSNTVTIIVH